MFDRPPYPLSIWASVPPKTKHGGGRGAESDTMYHKPTTYQLTDYDLDVLWEYHQAYFNHSHQQASYRRYENREFKNPKCQHPNYVGILGEYATYQALVGKGNWERMLTFTTQRPVYRADQYDLMYQGKRLDVKTYLCDHIGEWGIPPSFTIKVDADSVTKASIDAYLFCFYDQEKTIELVGWRNKADFQPSELMTVGEGQNQRQVYKFKVEQTYRDFNLINAYAKTQAGTR